MRSTPRRYRWWRRCAQLMDGFQLPCSGGKARLGGSCTAGGERGASAHSPSEPGLGGRHLDRATWVRRGASERGLVGVARGHAASCSTRCADATGSTTALYMHTRFYPSRRWTNGCTAAACGDRRYRSMLLLSFTGPPPPVRRREPIDPSRSSRRMTRSAGEASRQGTQHVPRA
jgi:hypothetical protein